MLILTRRPGEEIYIGDSMVVTVLGVVGHQVRIGVKAPPDVTVDRAEVRVRKMRGQGGDASVDGNVADGGAIDPVQQQRSNFLGRGRRGR